MTRAPPAAPPRCTITESVPSLVSPAPGIHRRPLARSHARTHAHTTARTHARATARPLARSLDRSPVRVSHDLSTDRPPPTRRVNTRRVQTSERQPAPTSSRAIDSRLRSNLDRPIDRLDSIDRSIDRCARDDRSIESSRCPKRRARRASLGVRWGRARERRDDAEARRRRASRRAMAVVTPWTRTRGVGPRNASRRARTTCVRARR
jgi:hypothetical protein